MPEWRGLLKQRLAGLALTPEREAEIIEELLLHLDDRYRELVAGGRTPEAAEKLALAELSEAHLLRQRLGRLKQARQADPIVPGRPRRRMAADLWQDVRYGVRMLRRQPSFALAAAMTLALGIGANAAIFSLVNATLLQKLPVLDSAALLYVTNGPSGSGVFPYPVFAELRDRNDVFDGLIAWGPIAASLNADGETDLVGGVIVTGNYFEVLGVRAAHGRVLSPADDVTVGAHPVAVVSDGLWQRRFGGRGDILGHEVLLNGHRFTIVGVMPAGFGGAQLGVTRELYVPMMMQPVMRPPRAGYSGDMNPDLLKVRTNGWLFALGRLKPGVTRQHADERLTAIATAADRALRPDSPRHVISTFHVDAGVPGQRARVIPVARLLMFVVGAVLLIACANVANLLLSRATSRRREIAVRIAIGASRWRLGRQLLTESVILALAGGALGVGLALAGVQAFRTAPPPAGALPLALDFTIDWRVLAFAFALSVVTGLVFGAAPAIRASRPILVPALKDESFVEDERVRRVNLKKVLVVAQVALSLMLLLTAGLFVRSLRATQAVDPGFDVAKLLNAPLNINLLRYTRQQGRDFYQRVLERVGALPGVEAASLARVQVFAGGRIVSVLIEGRAGSNNVFQSNDTSAVPPLPDRGNSTSANVVTPRYFDTMGITLRQGRDFGPGDIEEAPPVAIVNQTFAALHFPNESPLGRRLSVNGPRGPWREIAGVVSDSKYGTLIEDAMPIVYFPLAQNHETGMTLHVRTAVDPASLIPAVRREIQAIEPNLPVPTLQAMSDSIGASLYSARMGAWLLSVFGALALLLASIGVYGVLSFSISRRTRELGIRQALGAASRDVFALVLKEGMWLVVIGVAIGLTGAFVGARLVARFLYGVDAIDAVTFAMMPLVLIAVSVVACLMPARRATKVAPTEALRYN